jgi:sarcosine oxidase gamma subunit
MSKLYGPEQFTQFSIELQRDSQHFNMTDLMIVAKPAPSQAYVCQRQQRAKQMKQPRMQKQIHVHVMMPKAMHNINKSFSSKQIPAASAVSAGLLAALSAGPDFMCILTQHGENTALSAHVYSLISSHRIVQQGSQQQ